MWYTLNETAQLLGVSTRTVKRWKQQQLLQLNPTGLINFEQAAEVLLWKQARAQGHPDLVPKIDTFYGVSH